MFKKMYVAGLLVSAGLSLTSCGGSSDEADTPLSKTAEPSATHPDTSMNDNGYEGQRVEERVAMPDWMPNDIWLPEDFEATQVQKIGTRTYILRGITTADTEMLLDTFPSKLKEAGYDTLDREDLKDQNLVQFDEKGLDTSLIRIRDDGDRRELQISLSFETE